MDVVDPTSDLNRRKIMLLTNLRQVCMELRCYFRDNNWFSVFSTPYNVRVESR
jgi:hypothetical protein